MNVTWPKSYGFTLYWLPGQVNNQIAAPTRKQLLSKLLTNKAVFTRAERNLPHFTNPTNGNDPVKKPQNVLHKSVFLSGTDESSVEHANSNA